MTVFLGTLWSTVKEVKAPFELDVEQGMALQTMQLNLASSHGEGEVSLFFSSCGRNLWFLLEERQGWPFKTRVCSVTSGFLSSCEGHLGILLEAWQGNRDTSQGEVGDPLSLSS